MPIRIYALAKELKIDSKELVDICAKAGLPGKGSALASLTDDEVTKLKAYLTGGGKKSKPVSASNAATASPSLDRAISRDDYVAPAGAAGGGKPKVIVPKTPPKPEPQEEPAAAEPAEPVAPAAEAAEAAADQSVEAPVDTPPVAPAAPKVREQPLRSSMSKQPVDPLAPVRPKPSTVESKPAGQRPKKAKPPVRKSPVVKFAAIPQSDQPVAKAPESKGPAPQKPIMTLPKGAIADAKKGSSAPLQQFTKDQERKRAQDQMVGQPPAESKGRGRGKGKAKEFVGGGEETKKKPGLAGMASVRNPRRRTGGRGASPMRRRSRMTRKKGTNTAAPRKGAIVVEMPSTIREFSAAVGISANDILRALMNMGVMVSNMNQEIDYDFAEMMCEEAGVDVDFRQKATLEDKLITEMEDQVDPPELLVPRPPVVTFLGHVDHGKTSLLDYLIGINVVSGEAGGITQHIRAYTIEKDGRQISFVDTPGHEAFTEMRARGANVTDIAVLVVAADDGVMPQTEEAISHARAAEVPIVVALNKIDLPGVDENKALQDLSTQELLPTEWGGDVEVIKTSATKGTGMDDLLETLLITADLHEYKANPDRAAMGTCLEAQQEPGRGVVAKIIVQNGTLKVGDVIVCGPAHGKVKAMYDTLHPKKKILEAGPSIPVNVTGLDIAPGAGDRFHVLKDIAQAREIAASREFETRTQSLSGRGTMRISFEEFQARLEEGSLGVDEELVTINIILRADVRGSIEAIHKEMAKLDHPEVQVKFLQSSVGGVTVADVTLADASNAVIVGFNVIPDEAARALADERGVEIRRYDIIYKVTEDIRKLLEGQLKPDEEVVELGRALVQRIFTISRIGTIAGCRVLAGNIERGCRIRVNRDGRGIGDYALDSLRREKDDAKEVREGFECGIKLSGFNDLKEGDVLEAYKIEEVARTL